jgi:hypothetical protein
MLAVAWAEPAALAGRQALPKPDQVEASKPTLIRLSDHSTPGLLITLGSASKRHRAGVASQLWIP